VSFFRFSFAIYSFPRVDRRPDFDGFHVFSTDRSQHSPQICRGIGLSVLEISKPLRYLSTRLRRSHQSIYDGPAAVDERRWFQAPPGCRQVTSRPLARPSRRTEKSLIPTTTTTTMTTICPPWSRSWPLQSGQSGQSGWWISPATMTMIEKATAVILPRQASSEPPEQLDIS
jgi:hypothetical protein